VKGCQKRQPLQAPQRSSHSCSPKTEATPDHTRRQQLQVAQRSSRSRPCQNNSTKTRRAASSICGTQRPMLAPALQAQLPSSRLYFKRTASETLEIYYTMMMVTVDTWVQTLYVLVVVGLAWVYRASIFSFASIDCAPCPLQAVRAHTSITEPHEERELAHATSKAARTACAQTHTPRR